MSICFAVLLSAGQHAPAKKKKIVSANHNIDHFTEDANEQAFVFPRDGDAGHCGLWDGAVVVSDDGDGCTTGP